MKQKLILGVLLIASITPVFALDLNNVKQKAAGALIQASGVNVNTNFKQIQAEKNYDIDNIRLRAHFAILAQDYEAYQENNKNFATVYGDLIKILNENKTLYIPETQYAERAKSVLDIIGKMDPEKPLKKSEFDKLKIIVPDNDWDKLSPELKDIINVINLY